jgi:two-component system chemotaxis sensor kinase CheA
VDFDFLLSEFVHETAPLVVEAEAMLLGIERGLASGRMDGEAWRDLLRVLHTIKGNAAMVHCAAVHDLAHAMEDRATAARDAQPAEQTPILDALLAAIDALHAGVRQPRSDEATARDAIDALRTGRARQRRRTQPGLLERVSEVRVSAEKLDRLLELVGELTTHHGRAGTMVRALCDRLASTDADAAATIEVVDQLGTVIREFRDRITEVRLLPLGATIVRFERLVRDLCATTGKRATLYVSGADTVVDKTIVDAVGEPLLHMLRNAIDHGVEPPAQRLAAGKAPEGRLDLTIAPQAGELVFSVRDDGAGIDRDRLVARAHVLGLDASGWTDDKILDLVFTPDLSTAEGVTNLSGRGVGLDAAKRAIERIGGAVLVESQRGKGTEFRFRVPLTLTIQRTLLVRRCDEIFAMPIASVLASLRVPSSGSAARGEFMRWRGDLVPLCDLGTWLAVPEAEHSPASLCVVVEDAGRPCGFLVDEVLGQQEVVLKDLDPAVGRPPGLAGATVLANGRVAMVLDPRAIAASRRTRGASAPRGAALEGRA